MLEIDWIKSEGWQPPKISPYHKLQIDPACSALHYGLQVIPYTITEIILQEMAIIKHFCCLSVIQCFEGMKAYIDDKDQIRLFRPEKNMERLSKSARRLFLPVHFI